MSDGTGLFAVKYVVLIAVAVAFTVGWWTRITTPVLLVMLTSLMRLAPLSTDAGDNLARIVLLFLCFADAARVWSWDARRRRQRVSLPNVARPPEWFGTLLHNTALVAIACQVFVLYVTSGLSKVQGSMWQEGVGLYYPLQIGQYASWPELNEIVYASGAFVTVGSYVTVFVQLFFPLMLLRRGTRIVALLAVFVMHVGIAVTMALPWFSLAMLATDAIFIRNDTYRAFARWLRRGWARHRHNRHSRHKDRHNPPVRSTTSESTTGTESRLGNVAHGSSDREPGVAPD